MTWRLPILFVFLSCLVTVWLTSELGLWTFRSVSAADKSEGDGMQRALQEKSHALSEKESELAQRERILLEKERVISQQLEKYERIIKELHGKLAEFEILKDQRMESFRQVYEKMEAKKAAKILEDLDVELSSKIVGGMKQDRAADVLGKMSSDKARRITERYIGKRVMATQDLNSSPTKQVNEVPTTDMKGGAQ